MTKLLTLALVTSALMAQSLEPQISKKTKDVYTKLPLTKKQKKARAKSKAAGKARQITRKNK